MERRKEQSPAYADVFRSMFYETLRILDGEDASQSERFAAEEAVMRFVGVLENDERCVADLLGYVRREIRRRRAHCRRAVIAAAALRSVRDHERAFATSCRLLQFAANEGDADTVSYLLTCHFATDLNRCDVETALLEMGYRVSLRCRMAVPFLQSLTRCEIKNGIWLRDFVKRELSTLEKECRDGLFSCGLERLREFAEQ